MSHMTLWWLDQSPSIFVQLGSIIDKIWPKGLWPLQKIKKKNEK